MRVSSAVAAVIALGVAALAVMMLRHVPPIAGAEGSTADEATSEGVTPAGVAVSD